jgi:hypothetical protein
MRVISKILTILAAIVLVGASVVFLMDKSDLAASLGYYANDMVAFVKDKDNRLIIVAYGAINLVLAFIYAIRRRKNKNTFNIIFLVVDFIIAFLFVIFKDKIKGVADLSNLTKIAVYMVLGAVGLLFIAALIPGKKKEKTPFSYKPLGLLPYVIAILGCIAVIVYAFIAKNGFESFGKIVRDIKNYMFDFDENWAKPRPRNVVIGLSGAIIVIFSILILIRRKRNILPALYVGAGLSILFVYLMKQQYVASYIKKSVADGSLTNNILVMVMLFGILVVELVAVFSFVEVLISFFDNDLTTASESPEVDSEQTAEVKALVEDINNDEDEEAEEVEDAKPETSEETEEDEETEVEEPEEYVEPETSEEVDVDDIDDEEDEDDDDDEDEEESDEDEEDEDEDDDDDNDDGAREALRRRRELIRQRILAARAESDEEEDEDEDEEAEEDEVIGYEDDEDEEESDEEEDESEDDEAEPEDIAEQEALTNGEEISDEEYEEEAEEEYADEDEQSDAYEESIAFDNEEEELDEEEEEDEPEEFDDESEEEFDDEEFDDEDSEDNEELDGEMEDATSSTGHKIPKIKSKPLDEKMVTVLDDEKKQRYNTIRNALQSYKKVSERLSSKGDSYRFHRDLIAKMTISGKTLRLHLALNPEDFEESKYSYQDLSAKQRYMYIPMTIKLRSNRSVKQALELIEMLAQTFGLEKNSRYKEKDYVKDLEAAYYAKHAETESNDAE